MKTKTYSTILLILCATVLTGCMNTPDGSNDGNNGDSSGNSNDAQSNTNTAKEVFDNALQMLDDGADVDETRMAMLAELQSKSNVEAAEIDEHSDVVWADFENGETRLFAIYDDENDGHDEETWSQLVNEADAANQNGFSGSFPLRPIAKVRRTQIIPELPDSSFLIPASNRAVVANGLTPFHADWPHEDNRPQIASMLEDLGYVVTQTDLNVDLFTHLSDYGVIYTESHGGWRAPSIQDLTADPSGIDPNEPIPTCFGSPSTQWVLTTTEVTDANRATYQKDVDCRRLMIMHATLRSRNKPEERKEFYCVTPLFIREYDKNNFPDRTFMYLNSCRGFDASQNSHFRDVLDERCVGGTYMAWMNKPHPVAAFRAGLNFFQLMCGTNQELSTKSIPFLEENVPPITNMSIAEAFAAMFAKGYTNGLIASRGAMLFYRTEEDTTGLPPILTFAPVISDFFLDEIGNAALQARSPDNAELIIGDAPGNLPDISTVTIDIGKTTALQTTNVTGTGYALKVPVGAEGELRLRKDGRTSPPMQLLTWKPSFVIRGTGPDGLTFTATFLMHGRGLPAPRSRSGAQGTFLWLEPTEAFDARFDAASTVTWSVGGSANVGGVQYSHSGGGSQTISFKAADGTLHSASMISNDGLTAEIDFTVETELKYTTTISGNGPTTMEERTLPVGNYSYAPSAQLGQDWTLQSGSLGVFFTQTGWTGDMTWNAATPTPPYDYEKFRR
ncbi:MAG: hypothetical protein DHS20C16_23530 [Phycisphaerae bacterium]|nr:MAG: hypothetical protein DHS20C16_23530 [Phycisphaerae bacterium]